MQFNPETLKKARDSAGMSMEALAKRANVSIGTIHNLEAGTYRSPRADIIAKVASALGVDWVLFFDADLQLSEGCGLTSAAPPNDS